MNIKNSSLYVSGLLDMASFNLGPSYTQAFCMDLNNYIESFAKMYNVSSNLIQLQKINCDLSKFFGDILCLDEKAVKTLVYWITTECGNCLRIHSSNNNELINSLCGKTFYFLEDIYFIEFEKETVCLMIGNNE